MSKPLQFGCKKCGGVVVVDLKPWSDHVDVKVHEGKIHDSFGKIEVQCKKCSKAVAVLAIEGV